MDGSEAKSLSPFPVVKRTLKPEGSFVSLEEPILEEVPIPVPKRKWTIEKRDRTVAPSEPTSHPFAEDGAGETGERDHLPEGGQSFGWGSDQIYVLRLRDSKWYIGKTRNIIERVKYHSEGTTEWTRLHPIIRVEEVIPLVDEFDEDNKTKKYMRAYGIDNVRGGSYTSTTFPVVVRALLEKELCSADDRCFVCGNYGHFAKDCLHPPVKRPATTTLTGAGKRLPATSTSERHIAKGEEQEKMAPGTFNGEAIGTHTTTTYVCGRCGRNSHVTDQCYAKSHLKGYQLPFRSNQPTGLPKLV
jgi:predicted GIY-YIG superfamily endonuclease